MEHSGEMSDLETLQNYRWLIREREALRGQLERRENAEDRRLLQRREEALAEQEERFEAVLSRAVFSRTHLVLWQYYGLGWTDEAIAAENGISTRLANHIRNHWLQEQGLRRPGTRREGVRALG